jgi:hypothetical protein
VRYGLLALLCVPCARVCVCVRACVRPCWRSCRLSIININNNKNNNSHPDGKDHPHEDARTAQICFNSFSADWVTYLRTDGKAQQIASQYGCMWSGPVHKSLESGEKGQVGISLLDPKGLPLTHTSSGLVMTEDQDLKHHQTPVAMQLAVQPSSLSSLC